MEVIKVIEEVTYGEHNWYKKEGFAITTDKQVIRMGISNDQSCCENWGYFMSNDNPGEFIDAELFGVTVVDTCLNTHKMDEANPYGLDAGEAMFVNFETSKGTLQFTAYNSHNGYYGHTAEVKCEQLDHEVNL